MADRRKWISAGISPELFKLFAYRRLKDDRREVDWRGIACGLTVLSQRLKRKTQHRRSKAERARATNTLLRRMRGANSAATFKNPEFWRGVCSALIAELVELLPRPRGRQTQARGLIDRSYPLRPWEVWRVIGRAALQKIRAGSPPRQAILDVLIDHHFPATHLEYYERRFSETRKRRA